MINYITIKEKIKENTYIDDEGIYGVLITEHGKSIKVYYFTEFVYSYFQNFQVKYVRDNFHMPSQIIKQTLLNKYNKIFIHKLSSKRNYPDLKQICNIFSLKNRNKPVFS